MKGSDKVPNMESIIRESFIQYSGAVLQSRALVDVRDCLKPSARQIFYCMQTDKFVHSKPFKKTLKAIGSAMRMYIHGDSSCEGVIMRAGQPFAMRYPIVEVEGSYGNLMESGNWAAPRYTSSRLSKLSENLFTDIKKDTITEWRDNYDDTEQYPAVLTSKGFYNLVNGSFGIGIGASSSIPQYNIKELNEALIKLLWNPDIDFEEIYCAPDFATGAILLNENEVKESMKNGQGKACKLRSVIEFEPTERVLVVKEIPYSVYTNTICGELEAILNSDDNPGIVKFNDLTAAKPNIKIYLAKGANVNRVLKYLYKNTSLQYYYGINFTMLEMGRYPKVFTWKEALQAHLDHEVEVYTRAYNYDLAKIAARIHIIEGLLKALENIEEVIKIIKGSSSSASAARELQNRYGLDELQTKAILDMKLARLAHLEVDKLTEEYSDLKKESERINTILNSETLLKKEIENGLRKTADFFGDPRRTQIVSVSEGTDEEPIERKQLSLAFTNEGAIFVTETSTLYSQRRNGVGSKFKLKKGEFIVDNLVGENTDTILFFTSKGNFYHLKMGEFSVGEKQYLSSLIPVKNHEIIKAATILSKSNNKKHIIFITKNGILKKSEIKDYNLKRNTGASALTLDANDEIVSVLFTDEERIGMLSQKGNFIMIETKDIRAIGRTAKGVCGMKLNAGDYVVGADTIPNNSKEILSITSDGYSKRSTIDEFKITGRATKGSKIQKAENLCDFVPIVDSTDILINSTTAQIRVKVNEINLLSRGSQGTKTIKMKDGDKVVKVCLV